MYSPTIEHRPYIGDQYAPGTRTLDLDRLENALEIFGSMAPGALYVHHVQVVLFIARHGDAGCTYGAIEKRFSLSNASASRTVNALSDNARHRKSTLGLVELFIDPEEGRRYRTRLTAKGKAVMRSIQQLQPNGGASSPEFEQLSA